VRQVEDLAPSDSSLRGSFPQWGREALQVRVNYLYRLV
jgi:hypothetical protein